MKLPRRKFLHLAAGAVAPSVASSIAKAQVHQTPTASDARERPLAERLAAYASWPDATKTSTTRPSSG